MAQADQTVQNATFPSVRADINSNLAALFSKNSGNSAPSTTVAFMDWIDTSGVNPVWKKRNAANNAWITLGTIISNTIAFEGTLPNQSGNSGKYLTTNGTTASWATITASGQLLQAPQILTTGTSYTTPANCTSIYVEAVGAGGGGGGCSSSSGSRGGGGGGSGGYSAKYFTVTPSTSYTYAIGAGGAGGTNSTGSTTGTDGGNTTFTVGATTITSNGGSGGTGIAGIDGGGAGGSGGVASNGDLNVNGGPGGAGIGGSAAGPSGGAGGNSLWGGAGAPRSGSSGAGNAGSSGGGGGGARAVGNTSFGGGDGGNGIIRIWEYS